MRINGKPREVFNPVRNRMEFSPYPLNREDAIRENVPKFWNLNSRCARHPEAQEYVYTFVVSGHNACCVHEDAIAAYREAVIQRREPQTVNEAHTSGLNFYWSSKPHLACGHYGKTTLAGKCFFCENNKQVSPRQVALQNGSTWYQPLPGDLCSKGHNAPRRVNNGSCQQCEADRNKPVSAQPLYRTNPDMVITRKDALALGFNVYRTGNPCQSGHTGWRYVSTGGCIECLRGVK